MSSSIDLDHSSKMNMSLDDIILFEQKKKKALRSMSTDSEDDEREDSGNTPSGTTPQIHMTPLSFSPPQPTRFVQNSRFRSYWRFNRNNDSNNWQNFRKTSRHNLTIRKRGYNGIPLINMKRSDGRNSSYTIWKQKSFGRNFFRRYGHGYNLLTSRNLNRFDSLNPNFIKRGPGSAVSQGSRANSVCSHCSNASVRSNLSFRSNHSIGSFRSLNNHSNTSHRSSNRSRSNPNRCERFTCHLNLNIYEEIKTLQEKKALRIQNTSRENINDEPTKCRPVPHATGISFNHRFKQLIANLYDL